MIRPRRKIDFAVVAVFLLCAWFLFEGQFHGFSGRFAGEGAPEKSWQYGTTEPEQEEATPQQEVAHAAEKEISGSASATLQQTSTLTQNDVLAAPSSSLPDRVVVMAKLPTDDTRWVHTDLKDWQAAIYDIDVDTPHGLSTLDPLSNSTLRTLRNKGMEANAYLAYIVQNYHSLPSTIAFIHPHKDGYPIAWHTDNPEHSNVASLQALNINFIQSNGYANLRCVQDPGCPQEVMPFRDPPEEHRTIEAAMPDAWQDLFNNTEVPHILATPCCAQFAVSSKQVQKRSLAEYQRYYKWLMATSLKDETSGRVFEYLWHVLFGQEPVYCPTYEKCYCDVYNKC